MTVEQAFSFARIMPAGKPAWQTGKHALQGRQADADGAAVDFAAEGFEEVAGKIALEGFEEVLLLAADVGGEQVAEALEELGRRRGLELRG
jgi:hypothetical protein